MRNGGDWHWGRTEPEQEKRHRAGLKDWQPGLRLPARDYPARAGSAASSTQRTSLPGLVVRSGAHLHGHLRIGDSDRPSDFNTNLKLLWINCRVLVPDALLCQGDCRSMVISDLFPSLVTKKVNG